MSETTTDATGQAAFKFQSVNSDNSRVVGCCDLDDICEIIRDDVTYPYKNGSQTARFYGIDRRSGLMNAIGLYTNMMSMNDKGSYMDTPDGRVFQATLPRNGAFQGGGPRVVEMPMNAGHQLIRKGFKEFRASRDNEYAFTVTQEMLDLNADPIPSNQNQIFLPEFYQVFASDDAACGCASECCGDGVREWFITKKDGRTEKMWVRSTPPEGVVDTTEYGIQADGSVKVWVIRGVGQTSEACDATFEPTNFGTPVEIECGDQIKIGNVIPLEGCGCLPCPSIRRRKYKRIEFENYAQRIVDGIYCFSQAELYSKTYLNEPNHIKNEYKRQMDGFMKRVANTFMYGQKGQFPGANLNNDLYPGAGTNETGCNSNPFTTDGLMTQIKKGARDMTVCVPEGCDNTCLIENLTQILNMLTGDDVSGNPVLVGDDYIFHYINTMIKNAYTPNTRAEAINQVLGGMEHAVNLPGNAGGMFSYSPFNIGGRMIPFILDREIQREEEGVLYLIYLDAIEVFHPNNELDKRNGFIPSTAKSGSLMPNIYTDETSVNLNGSSQMISKNNCPKKVYATMQFGVWYTPEYLPKTFRIKFQGVNEAGDNVGLDEVSCGCYGNGIKVYESLVS